MIVPGHLTLSQTTYFRQVLEFKLDENEGKFSKREENTEEKGEIAWHKQFLLYTQCI